MYSITSLIDLLNKPALLYWSNNIGLRGVNLRDYKSELTNKGTLKHNQIEDYFNKGTLFDGCDKLSKCIEGFSFIGSEVDIDNGFICGRVDLILEKSKKIYVIDFKSSKNIYLSTKLQLSSYKEMYGADEIAVIDLNDFSFNVLKINTKKYFNIIKRLYQIKELLNELKERL